MTRRARCHRGRPGLRPTFTLGAVGSGPAVIRGHIAGPAVQNDQMKLSDMDFPEEVIAHPRQWAAQASVAELIARLRACETVQDRHEFQNDLLNLRLAVEAD